MLKSTFLSPEEDPGEADLHLLPTRGFHDHSWGNGPAVEGALLLWQPPEEMSLNMPLNTSVSRH